MSQNKRNFTVTESVKSYFQKKNCLNQNGRKLVCAWGQKLSDAKFSYSVLV